MTHSPDVLKDSNEDVTYRSPLWMVTQEPVISHWVAELQRTCQEQLAYPERNHELRVSLSVVDQMRENFAALIRRGESKLHRLCAVLCHSYLTSWEIHSVVIGEVRELGERFTLVQSLRAEEVFQMTDLDLGQRQLRKLRIGDDQRGWIRPTLVANFLDYEPLELDQRAIHRITSRIKAEEEIWNKVVDELFDIDLLVKRDKQLRHLSRYVKDIFGLKVVVGESEKVRSFHQELGSLRLGDQLRQDLSIPLEENTACFDFLETKDYLDGTDPKRSGWQAIKSVVRWWGETFEVQVQPLRNYLRERERLSQESHASFRTRREDLRAEVARRIPLYGFYRNLLRWLFLRPDVPPPEYPHLKLELVD